MKNQHLRLIAIGSLISLALSADSFAKERGNKAHSDSNSIRYSQSASEPGEAGGGSFSGISLGVSTIQNINANASVSALFALSPLDAIQVFLSVPTTNPFNIGGMGLYKRTLLQHGVSGFHVGGGVGAAVVNGQLVPTVVIPTSAQFALNIIALMGIHLEIPGLSHVQFHLDAGPNFTFVTPSNTGFTFGGLSPALGLSVLYTL